MTNDAREFDTMTDLIASLTDIGYGDIQFTIPVQVLTRFRAFPASYGSCEIGMWSAQENDWMHVGAAYPLS